MDAASDEQARLYFVLFFVIVIVVVVFVVVVDKLKLEIVTFRKLDL